MPSPDQLQTITATLVATQAAVNEVNVAVRVLHECIAASRECLIESRKSIDATWGGARRPDGSGM
jgi:hypothetical protein